MSLGAKRGLRFDFCAEVVLDQSEKVVCALFDRVWNAGELDAVDQLLGPQYHIHSDPGDPWDGQTLTPAGFKDRLTISRAPFPDLHFEIDEVVSDRGRVAVSWTMSGTNEGPLGGRPATGKSISAKGITIYFVENGRITGHKQAVDRLSIVSQLGMVD